MGKYQTSGVILPVERVHKSNVSLQLTGAASNSELRTWLIKTNLAGSAASIQRSRINDNVLNTRKLQAVNSKLTNNNVLWQGMRLNVDIA